ncbi:unnamed protein product, partial [Rhizophagus irregularis]
PLLYIFTIFPYLVLNFTTSCRPGVPLSSEPISGMWIQVSKESRENIRAVVEMEDLRRNLPVISLETMLFIVSSDFYRLEHIL